MEDRMIKSYLESINVKVNNLSSQVSDNHHLIQSLYELKNNYHNKDDYNNLLGKHLYAKSCISDNGGLYIYKVVAAGRFMDKSENAINEGLLVKNVSQTQDCMGRFFALGSNNVISNVEFVSLDDIGKKYFTSKEEAEQQIFNKPKNVKFKRIKMVREFMGCLNRSFREYTDCYVQRAHMGFPYEEIQDITEEQISEAIENKKPMYLILCSTPKESPMLSFSIRTDEDILEYEFERSV